MVAKAAKLLAVAAVSWKRGVLGDGPGGHPDLCSLAGSCGLNFGGPVGVSQALQEAGTLCPASFRYQIFMKLKLTLETIGIVPWTCVPKKFLGRFQEDVADLNRHDETVTNNVLDPSLLQVLIKAVTKEKGCVDYQRFLARLDEAAKQYHIKQFVFS